MLVLAKFWAPQKTDLDLEIDRVLKIMSTTLPENPEYSTLLEKLERLNKMRSKNRPRRISRDAVVTTLGNLAGILVIVAYEQKHVMTSKGLTFVPKVK